MLLYMYIQLAHQSSLPLTIHLNSTASFQGSTSVGLDTRQAKLHVQYFKVGPKKRYLVYNGKKGNVFTLLSMVPPHPRIQATVGRIRATVGCTGAFRSLNNKSRALVCAQLIATAVMKGTKVQTLGGRAVAGAWLVAWAVMAMGAIINTHAHR